MKGGFNTNVEHKGVVFHVQTQDKGPENGYIECLIYTSGQILASRRIPYSSIFERKNMEDFQRIIEEQHKSIIKEIKEGKFDHYLTFEKETQLGEKKKTTIPEKLDIEFLEFKPPTPTSPYFYFSIKTINPDLKISIPYVNIKVDVITEFGRNFSIFEGRSDDEGKISMKLLIPEFKEEKFILFFKASRKGFMPREIKKFFRKATD